jgi:hypothetical protein
MKTGTQEYLEKAKEAMVNHAENQRAFWQKNDDPIGEACTKKMQEKLMHLKQTMKGNK